MSGFLDRATGLVVLEPVLLALGLIVLLGVALERAVRRRGARASLPPWAAPASSVTSLPPTWRVRLAPLPMALAGAGLLLLVVALGRPGERVEEPRPVAGIDLVLALDVSSSMSARDGSGGRTRLSDAIAAAERFVARRTGDRIGLIAFARSPELLCPPTRDHAALLQQLRALVPVPGDSPQDATAVGAAAALAAQALGPDRGDARVAILLTDGEENVALVGAQDEVAPAHAAQWAARLGVRLHVIASAPTAGGPGATDPPPDLAPVRAMAERTGGRLFQAGSAAAQDAVYAAIDGLEARVRPDPTFVLEDRFAPFLAVGLLLLVLSRLLAAGPLAEVA
jgi:Ca-activated chloride channel homolog